MGNESSNMSRNNIIFNDQPVEKTLNNLLYDAEQNNIQITVHQEISKDKIAYFQNLTPLDRNSKNLLIYRHPTIPRYIGSWKNNGNFYLATERCRVLSNILPHQNDIQICLGLKNILGSLIFLTEQANCRHLNICVSSIYEANSHWKLMGFEHLWKNSEVSIDLLERSKPFRYQDAIDPNELKNNCVGIEQFAFAVLCESVLKKNSQIQHVKEFIEYCKTHLKHSNPNLRPTLSAILLHPYFNHDFINIHSFLTELPLKTQQARQEFFTQLNDRLRNFEEDVVGTQLSELLMSRVVLLDQTAQMCFLPFLLRPQRDEDDIPDMEQGLFSQDSFVRFLIPKLKKVFCVRDIQIRLVLLEFFPQYCMMFSKDELTDHVLPQLLLGIKDTNDLLVTKTLICLAELIPILGATLVIGANRKKLFSDGRPNVDTVVFNNDQPRSITPVINSIDMLSSSPPLGNFSDISINESNKIALGNGNVLAETEKDLGTDNELEDGDEWSWDDPNQGNEEKVGEHLELEAETEEFVDGLKETASQEKESSESPRKVVKEGSSSRKSSVESSGKLSLTKNPLSLGTNKESGKKSLDLKSPAVIFEKPVEKSVQEVKPVVKSAEKDFTKRKQIPDIETLDIKNQRFSKLEEKSREFDFFKDMAPVIQKPSVHMLDVQLPINSLPEIPSKKQETEEAAIQVNNKLFEMKLDDCENGEQGWDEDTDW